MTLEFHIDARHFVQHVALDNRAIEAEIERGINMALQDVLAGDNFARSISEATKKELRDIVHKTVFSWEVRNKITKTIEDKIGQKIEEYAEKVAEQVTSSLK